VGGDRLGGTASAWEAAASVPLAAAGSDPFSPKVVAVTRTPAGTFTGISDDLLLQPLRTGDVKDVKFNLGGSSVSLRVTFTDGSRGAFKPLQTNPQSVPRKEIAAYWINRLLGLNNVPPASGRTLHHDDIFGHLVPESRGFLPRLEMPAFKGVAEWYYEWMRHGPYDPWWQWAELTGRYDRVSAAVLNISAWHDEMYGPIGATTNFSGLVRTRGGDARTARTQLVIGPWTHGSDWDTPVIGTRDMGAEAVQDYDALILDWMDRWVQQKANGVDQRPPVRLYAMGANAWRTGDAWPPPADRRALYLAGSATAGKAAGTLTWDAPTAETRSVFVSDAAHPVRDPHDTDAGGLDYRALSADPGVVTFETAPLENDLELLGPIEAEMHISVDRPDTDLWVKLLDVAPDGTAWGVMSIGLDVLRASYRNHTPTRELLQPGEIYTLHLREMMTGNRFLKGHRLRVAVMAAFAPNMSWNLHTGRDEFTSSETAVARVTVYAGGRDASRLTVPVAGR
jgi:putative CocE/NonD family hydrolase